MMAASYRAVDGFERPRTAPMMRLREAEEKMGHVAVGGMGMGIGSDRRRTPPRRNPARAAGRSGRMPPRRGQVKVAIAQSVWQTLSSVVQGARAATFRRSFSWSS